MKATERGAVIVMVAILFGSGVLLGLVSLVVDSGQLLLEKTITQISADNVATALAHHCAASTAECTSAISASSSLVSISKSTFSKHPPAILSACGSTLAVTLHPSLTTCSNYKGIPRDCVAPSVDYPAYVRVYTGYTAGSGGTPLFPLLSNLIQGTNSNPSIQACSQAAWGSISSMTSTTAALPFNLAISLCTAVDSTIVGKTTGVTTGDTVIEGLLSGRNNTTSTTCAGKKDQTNKNVTYPSGAQFVGFTIFARPTSGRIAIGDTLTEEVWKTATITTYQNGLKTMIPSPSTAAAKSYLVPVVADTRAAAKVVVAFVSMKILGYRFYNTTPGNYSYWPTTFNSTNFPQTQQNTCSNFCLVGAISNGTSQAGSLLTPSVTTTSYNLGVNTIRPLQ